MPRCDHKKISVEYILKKMRKEFIFYCPLKSNTKEDRNEGKSKQKLYIIENK